MSNIRYGTSSWSEKSWVGPFYPPGTRAGDMLPFYATQFDTVEADSTYYRNPGYDLAQRWARILPEGFLLSTKLPRECFLGGDARELIPEHVFSDVQTKAQMGAFLAAMSFVKEAGKAGPILIQCPYFNQGVFPDLAAFLERVEPFLRELGDSHRWALEIRNPNWLREELFALLRRYSVAFCLSNVRGMPHPAAVAERFDVLTTDFFYARLIGDRQAVEKLTKTFDKVVIDQSERLAKWAALLPVLARSSDHGFVYANNHYEGHGPATIRQLRALVEAHG